MSFLNQIFNFFNNNNKRKKPEEKVSTTSSINVQDKSQPQENSSETTTTPSTSYVSKKAPTLPPPALPEVEFEESRNLLQLDFFCQTEEQQEQELASFPKFDYLLKKKNVVIDDDTVYKKPHRKLSTTLRHRISLYRPNHNKTVKRTLSTPDLYSKN